MSIAGLQHKLKVSEDQSQLLSAQKEEIKSQIDQLSQMSGDSSQQVSFLQEQLGEKEK